MSLNEVSLIDVVKKQVQFKVKSYTGIFHSLIILQFLGLFISTLGEGSMTEPGYGRSISVSYFSSSVLMGMTAMWLFLNTLLLTTRAYRDDDFTFVSTRWSRLLANFIFMILLALLGTVTSFLALNVLKVYLFLRNDDLILTNSLTFSETISSTLVLLSYLILISAAAYSIGSIIQRNKWVGIGISLFLIVLGAISVDSVGTPINFLIYFIMHESSLVLLLLKISITSGILFFISWVVSDSQEVRL
ncbi:hypothetical protein [Paenisporosarcina indica]|uniref:hypothetical protein n=1 Tax=Paenisporosarcina indica TaxID=650093 RepID=UPI0009501C0C|nr:hypothetical protein [Paenisporosarcina indica]